MTHSFPMLDKFLISDLPTADEILPQLRRLDASKRYTNYGPLVDEFEQRMLEFLTARDPYGHAGALHLTTVVTGHHALEVGLRMLKVGAGSKVLVPAVTFPSSPLSAQLLGANVILADVDVTRWTLTPEIALRAAEKIKFDAVMPVALYGVPVPVEGWDRFTETTGIPVIIDAAAAIETQLIPKQGLVAHSLHATKPFGVGEGGLLVGRSVQQIAATRVYSNFGTYDRVTVSEGSNTKMSEFHAAVALQQVKRWEGIKTSRRTVFEMFRHHLQVLGEHVSLQPDIDKAVVSSLMLRFKKPVAAEILARGLHDKIAFHRMYLPPLYHHPHFVGLGMIDADGVQVSADADYQHKVALMPNSEMMLAHIIGVPFHPFLAENDILRVIDVLGSFCR